jgi:hypothetical protein
MIAPSRRSPIPEVLNWTERQETSGASVSVRPLPAAELLNERVVKRPFPIWSTLARKIGPVQQFRAL